jgi:hypothetical protein
MRVQKVRLFFIACSLRLRKQRVGVSFPFSLPGNHETLRSTSYLRSDVGLGITSHSPDRPTPHRARPHEPSTNLKGTPHRNFLLTQTSNVLI